MRDVSRVSPSQEDMEARDAEEERRAVERVTKEQEAKQQQAEADLLEYLRRGGDTEPQRQARQRLRDVHTVVAGRWEVKAKDAWTPHFAELAKEATEVAEVAVREWAALELEAAEAELQAADAAKEAFLRDSEPSGPFWRRVLK